MTNTHPPAADRIKDALEALFELESASACSGYELHLAQQLRIGLEAAVQETRAWEAIEAWLNVPERDEPAREITITRWVGSSWEPALAPTDRNQPPQAETRAEAIGEAAAWCRAELVK
jgi:hypothetical protein